MTTLTAVPRAPLLGGTVLGPPPTGAMVEKTVPAKPVLS